jgi:DNA-binding transcriptional regulator YiaG
MGGQAMTNAISFKHAGSPTCEPLHYTACGLDNVYLTSGYEVRDVAGEQYISVRDVKELHETIAIYLVRQKKVLAGREVRFLRKQMELTQKELGGFLGVSDQSVARYEKDLTRLEGSSDSLLRLLVAGHVSGRIDVQAELCSIRGADDVADDVVTLGMDDDEWRVAA